MDKEEDKKDQGEGNPSRATFHTGSTTQAGSNFGQGSHQLGKQSHDQGSESDSGADYENEQGWNNEALRSSDLKNQSVDQPDKSHEQDSSQNREPKDLDTRESEETK